MFRYLISTLSQQRECAAIISVREEGRAPDRLQSDARRWKRNNNYVMAHTIIPYNLQQNNVINIFYLSAKWTFISLYLFIYKSHNCDILLIDISSLALLIEAVENQFKNQSKYTTNSTLYTSKKCNLVVKTLVQNIQSSDSAI